MFSLVYSSIASPKLDSSNLDKIHSTAMAFNKNNSITGCLLYHEGKFVQLLEGSKYHVINLYENIVKDTRHISPIVLHTEHSHFRMFKDWSMIFHNLSSKALKDSSYKIQCFTDMFNSSNANCIPSSSKLKFWRESFEIFNKTPSCNPKEKHLHLSAT